MTDTKTFTSPKTKAFIYLRKSQDREDRQVLSIEGQLKIARKLVEQHCLAPNYLPREEQSAYKKGRPIFNDMMDKIEDGEVRHIVCWDAKRLSRNPYDAGRIIGAMSDDKLLSIITDGQIFHATPTDMFYLTILLGMSKKESDDTSAGVHRGYSTKYERGEYPSYAPTGYINIKIGHNRNIAPDPDRAPIYLKVCEEAASGKYTFDELWKYARDDLGFTSRYGQPIKRSSLWSMLQNSLYYGYYKHGGEWHWGEYERIISQDLFDRVQLAMGWRKQQTRNTTKGAFYPYKLLTCAHCGHNLTAYTKPKKLVNGQIAYYTYYVCTRKSKITKCREPQIDEPSLKEQFENLISPMQITKEEAHECLELIRHFHREMTENRAVRLADWRKEQKETEKRLAQLLEMRMSKELNHEEFMQHKQTLNEQMVRTKQQIDQTHSNADRWLELAEELFSSAVNIVDTFKIANEQEKRQILLELGSNWQMSNKKVRFTPRKPYDLLANRTSESSWRARPDSNRRSPP
jgi:site-specific DNA recombinase